MASAVVTRLLGDLDPKFLTQQLRHGVLGVELFRSIADAMKHHCAPFRDDTVDHSVVYANRGELGLGLQRLFDCAVAMKIVSDSSRRGSRGIARC